MRIYLAVLAALTMGTAACGKKETPKPATEQVKEADKKPEDPAKPEEPKKPEEPVAKPEEPKKPEEPAEPDEPPMKVPPTDRTASVQEGLTAFAALDFANAFKHFDNDAVWTEVGLPDSEIKGVEAITEFHKKQTTGWGELKMKAARIIEAGEYQAVELVWSGKHTGAFADGTAATNKEASLASGMLLHYNDKGLVDKVWSFQDWPLVLQQLGVVPGLAEGYVAAKLPETTDVVKGDFNPAYKDLYTAFGTKMKPDTIEAAIDEMYTDDFTMVDGMTGKTITGKAAMKETMKGWMAMFTTDSMTADMAFGAGDWLVVVATSTSTYKGGIPGVEAKDQKVTQHTLDFVRFENNKFKSYASYMNSFEVMAALGLTAGAAEKPADPNAPVAEVPSFGVASCDAYIKSVTACVGAMPEAGRNAFNEALAKTLESWKQVAAAGDAAKASLEEGCKSALNAAKQSMTSSCPDVKWE